MRLVLNCNPFQLHVWFVLSLSFQSSPITSVMHSLFLHVTISVVMAVVMGPYHSKKVRPHSSSPYLLTCHTYLDSNDHYALIINLHGLDWFHLHGNHINDHYAVGLYMCGKVWTSFGMQNTWDICFFFQLIYINSIQLCILDSSPFITLKLEHLSPIHI